MIGTFIVFVVVLALVASYILIVNRMLRSDEHWNEKAAAPSPVQRKINSGTVTERMSSVTLRPA
jgi:hypothetical protein